MNVHFSWSWQDKNVVNILENIFKAADLDRRQTILKFDHNVDFAVVRKLAQKFIVQFNKNASSSADRLAMISNDWKKVKDFHGYILPTKIFIANLKSYDEQMEFENALLAKSEQLSFQSGIFTFMNSMEYFKEYYRIGSGKLLMNDIRLGDVPMVAKRRSNLQQLQMRAISG